MKISTALKLKQPLISSDFFNRIEQHKAEFRNNILFKSMLEGRFSKTACDKFLFHQQFFSNQFQRLIMLRSAFCKQAHFENLFYEHLLEEIGHHKILENERNKIALEKDIIVEALCMWFPHQMFSSSPLEQLVIVNCGIETAAFILYEYAIPVFDPERRSEYFKIHEIHDAHHQNMGQNLLTNLTPGDYEQLIAVLDDTWAALNALMARFCILSLED